MRSWCCLRGHWQSTNEPCCTTAGKRQQSHSRHRWVRQLPCSHLLCVLSALAGAMGVVPPESQASYGVLTQVGPVGVPQVRREVMMPS